MGEGMGQYGEWEVFTFERGDKELIKESITVCVSLGLLIVLSCASPPKDVTPERRVETPGLFPVLEDGKYGYADSRKSTVIEPQFEEARGFSEGLAAVKVNGKWGYIARAGTMVIRPHFEAAKDFSEGRAAVKTGDRWGYIDTTGTALSIRLGDLRIESAGDFSDGYALVEGEGGRIHIDRRGFPVSNPERYTEYMKVDESPFVTSEEEWELVVSEWSTPPWLELSSKREDFDLKAVFKGSLDGASDHVALLWQELFSGVEIFPTEAVLEVYEVETAGDGRILRRKRDQIDDVSLKFQAWNGFDVNGDGLKEIVVDSWTGSSFPGSVRLKIFQLRDGNLQELLMYGGEDFLPELLEDIDGDGRLEVIAWQLNSYPYFCRDCQPIAWAIYTWKSGQYVEASNQFPGFYNPILGTLEKKLRSGRFDSDELFLSTAVTILLNYIQKGEPDKGWERYSEYTGAWPYKMSGWEEFAKDIQAQIKERYGF
jgi:hypothetical protein